MLPFLEILLAIITLTRDNQLLRMIKYSSDEILPKAKFKTDPYAITYICRTTMY